MKRFWGMVVAILCLARPASALDELVYAARPESPALPYILTVGGMVGGRKPSHAVILMPGGLGVLEPRQVKGRPTFRAGADFLIRSRWAFSGGPFVAASTDATHEPARILAIASDLQKRFGPLAVYVVGTSRSTEATMALAAPLDGQVAGFVHTSSMNAIASFDPSKFKSRHLLVVHRLDTCRVTLPSSSEAAHRAFGTELIAMEGGKSTADSCDSRSHHGYSGVERETVDRIKTWIEAGK